MQLHALFRLALASAPVLKTLTSLHNVTRRSVLQKVRCRAFNALHLLVNTGFQVLFHSPPGGLFTFPSRYYALSVTDRLYAWGVVPPASHRISRVPRYSGTSCLLSPSPTGLSPSLVVLSNTFESTIVICRRPATPGVRRPLVWPLPFSLATTKEIEFSFFSSGYLDVSLPRVPSYRTI